MEPWEQAAAATGAETKMVAAPKERPPAFVKSAEKRKPVSVWG
jgi:hypothetical protein